MGAVPLLGARGWRFVGKYPVALNGFGEVWRFVAPLQVAFFSPKDLRCGFRKQKDPSPAPLRRLSSFFVMGSGVGRCQLVKKSRWGHGGGQYFGALLHISDRSFNTFVSNYALPGAKVNISELFCTFRTVHLIGFGYANYYATKN